VAVFKKHFYPSERGGLSVCEKKQKRSNLGRSLDTARNKLGLNFWGVCVSGVRVKSDDLRLAGGVWPGREEKGQY